MTETLKEKYLNARRTVMSGEILPPSKWANIIITLLSNPLLIVGIEFYDDISLHSSTTVNGWLAMEEAPLMTIGRFPTGTPIRGQITFHRGRDGSTSFKSGKVGVLGTSQPFIGNQILIKFKPTIRKQLYEGLLNKLQRCDLRSIDFTKHYFRDDLKEVPYTRFSTHRLAMTLLKSSQKPKSIEECEWLEDRLFEAYELYRGCRDPARKEIAKKLKERWQAITKECMDPAKEIGFKRAQRVYEEYLQARKRLKR